MLRVPARRRAAERRAGIADAHDGVRDLLWCWGRDDEAVDPILDQLGRGVVLSGDDDTRDSAGGRLHDDETVTLATRGQDQA